MFKKYYYKYYPVFSLFFPIIIKKGNDFLKVLSRSNMLREIK